MIESQEDKNKIPLKENIVLDHRLLAAKLRVYDWMRGVPLPDKAPRLVEVRFKNTRKGIYRNPQGLKLKTGDIVAVEAMLGHDIGIVSLTGELVEEQIRMKRIDLERNPIRKIYRIARPNDIEKWEQAIALENGTMIHARQIAADLKLNMKIGDVEYQGDKTKAIFYYIADVRVDFRTLIKILADRFHIRVEMKQIGARQEAGRIGGIGPCGRELCCSTFISNFVSVSTSAARYQGVSLNPQKLAGQCCKLKCCLNYEVDAYIDSQKDFPSASQMLNTGAGVLYHQKTDIFAREMYYSTNKEGRGVLIKLGVDKVKEIIKQNAEGIIPDCPSGGDDKGSVKYADGVGEESLSRFDNPQPNRHSRGKKKRNNNGRESNSRQNKATKNSENKERAEETPLKQRNSGRNSRNNRKRRKNNSENKKNNLKENE